MVFDLKTLKAIGTSIAVGKKPDAILYEPATRRVFVFNGDSQDVSVINAAKTEVVGTLPLGGTPEFAAADGRGKVFVNLEDRSETLGLDARSLKIEDRWPLTPGETPTGLSMDTERRHLFVGCHDEKLIVLDATSGKVLAALPIGKGVDAAAFDAGTKRAFNSNGEGTLTVIAQRHNASAPAGEEFYVAENVPTKRGARTLALDAKTHAVYLAAADFEPPPAPTAEQPRPRLKRVPGSFVILKFRMYAFDKGSQKKASWLARSSLRQVHRSVKFEPSK